MDAIDKRLYFSQYPNSLVEINKAERLKVFKDALLEDINIPISVLDNMFYDDNGEIEKPFLLKSNEPSEIAKAIDTIVDSQKIRDKISEDGFDFIQKISNPAKIAKEWDDIFKDYFNKYQKIESAVPNIKISFLRVLYLISNRLHFRKMKIFNKC